METKRVSFDIPWASYTPGATTAVEEKKTVATDWGAIVAGVTAAGAAAYQKTLADAQAKRDADARAKALKAQQAAMDAAAMRGANEATGQSWKNYLPYAGIGIAALAGLWFFMRRR